MLSLAVAMGVGRFAFTPILPMMLADRTIDLPSASWLASANYLGYLAGALLCSVQPWLWRRVPDLPSVAFATLVRAGLVATALLTVAMAFEWPAAWPTLRFAAGVACAVVFVYTSSWCLARLAEAGRSAIGGIIYAGPGAGIVVSGLAASGMVAAGWRASTAWVLSGLIAALLTGLVWRVFRGGPERLAPLAATAAVPGRTTGPDVGPAGGTEVALVAIGYGLAGFGYIITATFLPVIARTALPGSAWLDLFWPVFGAGVVVGALLATRVPVSADRRSLLTVCFAAQAGGVLTGLVLPTTTGFVIGSLLLGLPFTAITFFAMQEARRLRPAEAAGTMGLLTSTYGIGQIVGPLLVAAILARSPTPGDGFTTSLEIAAGALLAGAAVFAWLRRAYRPVPSSGS